MRGSTRFPRAPVAILALCTALSLAACDRPPPEPDATDAPDAVDAVPVAVTIGEIVGPEEYQFGYVGGVAADAAERIYVADRLGSFIRVYGPGGEFLRQIGREGDGPGEFRHPTDLFFDEAGRLWVRDSQRATVLAPAAPDALPYSVVATRRFHGYTNWTSSARSRLVDGLYYYPGYRFPQSGPDRYFYFAYDEEGVTGDTVQVPPYATLATVASAYYRTSARGGRMVEGINRAPFESGPAWELTRRGTIIGGDGRGGLAETNRAGDTLRVIEVRPRRAVTEAERADSARSLQARVDSLPVPLDRVENVSPWVRRGELPDSVPAYLGVHTSETGEIWVRRWPPEGRPGHSLYHVHAPDGAFLRSVIIAAPILVEPPPFIGRDRFIGVVHDPATAVHRVVVVELDG